jgi:hypothetical protein
MMTNRRSPRLLLSTVAAGALLALTGLTGLASPPSFSQATSDVTPEPFSSIELTVRTCPAGYDPTVDGADYLTDCREQAGDTNFALAAGETQGPSASTGTSGDAPQQSTVVFSELTPGRYTVTATAPPEIAGAFIGSCASNVRSFEEYPFTPFATIGPNGAVALQLEAGEALKCDWFQIAAPSSGT